MAELEKLKELATMLIEKQHVIEKALITVSDPLREHDYKYQLSETQKQLQEVRERIRSLPAEAPADDAGTGGPGSQPLHDYHKFTCNRDLQKVEFQQTIDAPVAPQVQYFYVYGAELESHQGFFNRVGYELEGRLLDFYNPNLELQCIAAREVITLSHIPNPQLYRREIIKALFATFTDRLNEQEPLDGKTLRDLYDISDTLRDKKSSDYVCLLLRITEDDWDAAQTPDVVTWLIESFFNVDLPPGAPRFLVFFGLIFYEDDGAIEKEVVTAVKKGKYLKLLPELEPVGMKDIRRWLQKYHLVWNDDPLQRQELLDSHFSDKQVFNMIEVERKLQKIIDQYNE